MPVKSYKLGPGLLTLGEPGSEVEFSTQVRSLTIKGVEKVERTEAVPVLSGDELAAEESTTYDWSMTGNLIQDIDADGSVDWSWEHKGETVPFVFVPNTAKGRQASGTVIPAPLDFGGDVDKTKAPETPLTWRCPTEPALGAVVVVP